MDTGTSIGQMGITQEKQTEKEAMFNKKEKQNDYRFNTAIVQNNAKLNTWCDLNRNNRDKGMEIFKIVMYNLVEAKKNNYGIRKTQYDNVYKKILGEIYFNANMLEPKKRDKILKDNALSFVEFKQMVLDIGEYCNVRVIVTRDNHTPHFIVLSDEVQEEINNTVSERTCSNPECGATLPLVRENFHRDRNGFKSQCNCCVNKKSKTPAKKPVIAPVASIESEMSVISDEKPVEPTVDSEDVLDNDESDAEFLERMKRQGNTITLTNGVGKSERYSEYQMRQEASGYYREYCNGMC